MNALTCNTVCVLGVLGSNINSVINSQIVQDGKTFRMIYHVFN